jgi:2-polyprenyl-6-methoxyphenol hydroxylase-like FAD-dependent oxidoreductase
MKLLICGGGIAGLTLALRLEQLGHEAVLVEQSPSPRGSGYMIDFFGSGYDAAEKLGLLPQIEEIHYPITQLSFRDANGKELFTIPYKVLRRRVFGDRHFNFMRGDLELLLYSHITSKVEVRFGTTIDSLRPDGDAVFAKLSDGSSASWDVVAGADGIHSRVRALTFGEEARFVRFLGFHTAAYVLDKIPQSLGSTNSFDTITVPGRQVGVYPIRGERLATFFTHHAEKPAGHISRQAALKELREAYADLDWIVGELLDAAEGVGELYFDDISQIEMPRWSSGRVVLLGDACDAVSLLAGQGASMAMAGGFVLAEELHTAGSVAEALRRYESWVKPVVEQKQAAGRKLVDWFVPEKPWRVTVRNLALRLSIFPLTSFFVRRSVSGGSIFQN